MNSRLLPGAEEEFENAVARYETEQSGLGIRFAAAFERSVDRLKSDPDSWSIAVSLFRRCRVFGFPYDIVFFADELETVIVAIAHHHRRANDWLGRWPTKAI